MSAICAFLNPWYFILGNPLYTLHKNFYKIYYYISMYTSRVEFVQEDLWNQIFTSVVGYTIVSVGSSECKSWLNNSNVVALPSEYNLLSGYIIRNRYN